MSSVFKRKSETVEGKRKWGGGGGRNVIYLKTYFQRNNVHQAPTKSSDTTEAQGVTPDSPSQELRESDKLRPGVRSEEKLL